MNDMQFWGERFDYKGLGGCDSHCFIKRNGNVVLCTESPINQGTSITNFADELAMLVAMKFKIPFVSLVWIEHYTEHDDHEETFDLTEFSQTWKGAFFNAHWTYLQRTMAIEIFEKGSL